MRSDGVSIERAMVQDAPGIHQREAAIKVFLEEQQQERSRSKGAVMMMVDGGERAGDAEQGLLIDAKGSQVAAVQRSSKSLVSGSAAVVKA